MTIRAIFLAALGVTSALGQPVDTPASLAQARQARLLAGSDLQAPLFLCQPGGGGVVRRAIATQSDEWLAPTRAFDNLFYVGNGFVGVWIVRTSAGLILFDSSESEAQARDHLVPGLIQLGLDPATIRYVVVTHGHWDHFGGAAYLQQQYGARIALSAADWKLIETTPQGAPERGTGPIPRQDIVVTDGQVLTLGDTRITLYVTPGHTPGTVSAIVPARIGDRSIPLSLLGSTAFPPTSAPTERTGGLLAYDRSVLRFAKISKDAGAQGILNTHIFADGTRQRLDAVRTLGAGQHNPFLIGASATARYYGILHHCLLAAERRPEAANAWTAAAGSVPSASAPPAHE